MTSSISASSETQGRIVGQKGNWGGLRRRLYCSEDMDVTQVPYVSLYEFYAGCGISLAVRFMRATLLPGNRTLMSQTPIQENVLKKERQFQLPILYLHFL